MLNKILRLKKEELERSKREHSLQDLKSMGRDCEEPRGFAKALKQSSSETAPRTHIIAEVKKASPSKGVIREDFNPVEIADIYEKGGAVAISCLTEKNFFKGDIAYLKQIRKNISLPVLRKDFIVDDYQIYESKAYGADAFLLIASVLDSNQMKEYCHMGVELGLDILLEVHSKEELPHAVDSLAEIIGINNRNLKTFKTDLNVTKELLPLIPSEKITVSESGISCREDIQELKALGVDAFLIGEALMKEKSIEGKLKELMGQE